MYRGNNQRQHREHRPVPTHCAFCEQGIDPEYKNAKAMRPMLTEKGKIVSRSRTGLCLSHQRKLTKAVKYARYMAILPYVSLVSSSNN